MKIKDAFLIHKAKKDVWDVFQDVDMLAGWMPGCQSMKTLGESEFEAEMEVKTRFMTITFTAVAQIKDKVEEEKMTVSIVGTPLKLAGLFKTNLTARFNEIQPNQTEISYEMDVQAMGRLASLGDIMMKGVVKKSASEFAENVQNYFVSKTTVG